MPGMVSLSFGDNNAFSDMRVIKKTAGKIEDSPLQIDHTSTVGDYYMFLTEGSLSDDVKRVLSKQLEMSGYTNYTVVSATVIPFMKDEAKQLTKHMKMFRSKWEDYVNYKGMHAAAIMPFGAALYSINHSADLTTSCFYDDVMNKPYYYLNSKFLGNLDTFIFPVNSLLEIYKISDGSMKEGTIDRNYIVWKTRFFRKQLKNMLGEKKLPPDYCMEKYSIIRATDYIKSENFHGRYIPCTSEEIFSKLLNSEYLAWDTETTSLRWYDKSEHLVCITLCNDGKTGYFVPIRCIREKPEVRKMFFECLYTCKNMIGANIKFDLHWVAKEFPDFDLERVLDMTIQDVGQLSHAINSNRTKGLKPLTLMYTPWGGYDNALDDYKEKTKVANYSLIPDYILSQYATIDAIMTWRIYFALLEHCRWIGQQFPNHKPLHWTPEMWYSNIMMHVYPCFIRMEHRGMMVDKEYLNDVRAHLEKRIPVVTEKLCAIWNVDRNFKFGSTKELGKQIQKMGWPCIETAKDGGYATSDDCIQEWKRQGRPGINELIELRELNSFLGTFVGVIDEDSQEESSGWEQFITYYPDDDSYRINQSYIVNGTETYRCIGKDPNLQNVPAHSKLSDEVKRCITVPTALEYEIEDEHGNVYTGGALDTIEVEGRGRISMADVEETDTIIPDTFRKYVFSHSDVFSEDDADWAEKREKVYVRS